MPVEDAVQKINDFLRSLICFNATALNSFFFDAVQKSISPLHCSSYKKIKLHNLFDTWVVAAEVANFLDQPFCQNCLGLALQSQACLEHGDIGKEEKTYDEHHLDSKRGVHQLVLLPLQVAELSIEMAKKCLQMILDRLRQRLFTCSVLISSPLDDLCIDIWISVMIISEPR